MSENCLMEAEKEFWANLQNIPIEKKITGKNLRYTKSNGRR